jgi:AcrR family transcriptional regulator
MRIRVTITDMNEPKRAYSSEVRSRQAAATRLRILCAAQDAFVDPSHDFTLEQVAAAAGVSVQTVLRAFGSKEGLILEAIGTMREREDRTSIEPAASVPAAVATLFDDYEEIGDRVVRMLAEEHRIPGFAEVAAGGRAMHRAWVESTFSPWTRGIPARRRGEVVTALVAATDVYVWQLLRRDLGLGRRQAQSVVERLVRGALEMTEG